MTDDFSGALRRASEYFRAMIGAQSNCLKILPFLLKFDEASADRYRNYAFPDDGAAPDESTISQLVTAFEERSRTPRLEYIRELAPALEAVLVACGFTVEGVLPLMACTQATLREPATGVEYSLAVSAGDLGEAAEVQNAAYGAGPATTADVARLRTTVEGGGLVALARRGDGIPVGSGLVSIPRGAAAEVAAVGVLADNRRQGVGAGVTAFLAGQALAKGINMPFLMAAHEAEARVYRRIGFMPFGTMLHLAR